jgi:hypothetical protein
MIFPGHSVNMKWGFLRAGTPTWVTRSSRYVGPSCIAQFSLQSFGVYKTERTYFTSIVLPTLLYRHQLHCATNTAASSSTTLWYQHFCIPINCTVLPTLLHRLQLHCTTNTAASSSTALWYQYLCIPINCTVIPTLLHRHQLHCATNTAASSSTALCYQHSCILINCIVLPTLFYPHRLYYILPLIPDISIVTTLLPNRGKLASFYMFGVLIKIWWLINLTLIKNFLRSPDFWWDHRFECQSDAASCQFINAAEYNKKFGTVINPLLTKFTLASALRSIFQYKFKA